jgi:hypothetical protein
MARQSYGKLPPTYLFFFNTGINLTNQNDQSNGGSKKNHPSHTRHVQIDMSKMTK